MSFRGKVKAVLRVNESERLRRRDQAHGLQGEDAWMKKWNALSDAEKKALRRQSKKKAKKVKQPVEEAKRTVAQAHKIARERAEAGTDPEVLRQRSPDYVPTEEEKSKWAKIVAQSTARIKKHVPKKKVKKVKKGTTTNEDSDHPFYQKVKELSRGKKNKSLLEKKSNKIKTFKILLGTVGKKSKMVEANTDPEHDKGLTDMDPEAIRKQVAKEKAEYERLMDAEKAAAETKRKKKPTKTERRKKPRTGEGKRLNDLGRRLGIGGNWF